MKTAILSEALRWSAYKTFVLVTLFPRLLPLRSSIEFRWNNLMQSGL
jgi:hypothetical protein